MAAQPGAAAGQIPSRLEPAVRSAHDPNQLVRRGHPPAPDAGAERAGYAVPSGSLVVAAGSGSSLGGASAAFEASPPAAGGGGGSSPDDH
jgi:hypothetical protein